MMKQMMLPALAFVAFAPAAAQPASRSDMVPAVRGGQAVQLRADYVPASDFVPEMQDAAAAAALPPPQMDARLSPDPRDAGLPAGWQPASAQSWQPQPQGGPAQGWNQQEGWSQQQGWQQRPQAVQVVNTREIVPVPVPVAYGGWGGAPVVTSIGWRGGYGGGWNRGWRGGNRGYGGYGYSHRPAVVFGGGYGGGYGGSYSGGYGGWSNNYGGWNRGYGGGYYGRGRGGCRSSGGGALIGGIAGATLGYGLGNRWDRTPGVVVGGLIGALAGSALERSGC